MELSSRKGTEAPNIEIEVEDCEEYTTTFSFSPIVHMVIETFGATLKHLS